MDFMVINSWGEVVYHSVSPTASWDGRNIAGQPVYDCTYVCIIKAKGANGENFSEHQTVKSFDPGKFSGQSLMVISVRAICY